MYTKHRGATGGGDVLGRPQTQRKLDRSNRDWQHKSRNLMLKVGQRKGIPVPKLQIRPNTSRKELAYQQRLIYFLPLCTPI